MQVKLQKSTKPDKRYMVIIDDKKKVHFGLKNPKKGTYIDHKDDKIKNAWIARHSKTGNWTQSGIKTASWWAYHLLWNKKTLNASKADIASKFNVKFI